MKTRDKLAKIIQEAESLERLVEQLLLCVDGLKDHHCADLMKETTKRLENFRDRDKQLRHLEKRTMHSERLAAMGQMAAAISHDLRNPLSGIKVAAEYLMRKLKGQPDAIDIIVNIHNEVIFANNIISNILEHASIRKPNFEKASIKKLIEEAILTIAQQGSFNNITIEREISSDLPLLNLDPLQIRQVLTNLLINAAEAMLGGGEMKINACCEENNVIVKVIDTGTGIEETHMEKLFEPFFSTKVTGIGLGLAITKEIIENHGGTIEVESKLEKGATFTMSFPVTSNV